MIYFEYLRFRTKKIEKTEKNNLKIHTFPYRLRVFHSIYTKLGFSDEFCIKNIILELEMINYARRNNFEWLKYSNKMPSKGHFHAVLRDFGPSNGQISI